MVANLLKKMSVRKFYKSLNLSFVSIYSNKMLATRATIAMAELKIV
jgi:hypothetical protein